MRIWISIFGLVLVSACSSDTEEPIQIPIEELESPEILSFSPSEGSEGTAVTISGNNFDYNAENLVVKFNGTQANKILFSSQNQISTEVPIGASTGPISISVDSREGLSIIDFRIIEKPSVPLISEVSPSSALIGTEVALIGINFIKGGANLEIAFNGIIASQYKVVSDSLILLNVPVSAGTGTISIRNDFELTEGPRFIVETPKDYKIAFIGDSDIGADARRVLETIKNERVDAVVHCGDLNYNEIPTAFEAHVNSILGSDFPYFFSVGNHDDSVWRGATGYQNDLESRFSRLNIRWEGDLGVLSSFYFQGIHFVTSSPDELGVSPKMAGDYVRDALLLSNSVWRISFWHKNQRLMQIGGKSDEAGWPVYEESRKGGALIATGHEHSYCRTYEMSNFETQAISHTGSMLKLIADNPNTVQLDEGRSFAFVSGLGGKSIRDAEDCLENNPWWADVYHSNNGAQYGALIGEFNYNGDQSLARFYFLDIDGGVRDKFFVRSQN